MIQGFINSTLGLLFFIILARSITKAEMGVYAALISTHGVLFLAGTFGLSIAAARFISKLIAEGEHEKTSSASITIIKISIISSLFASAIYFVLAPYISLIFTKSVIYTDLFKLASIFVFTHALSFVVDGLMQGVREFNGLAIIRIVGQAARVSVTILLLLMGYGLTAVLIGWVVSDIFITILPISFLRRYIGLRGDPYPYRPIVHFSIPILGSSLLSFISTYADVFLIMIYFMPENVGAYNVAVTASTVILYVIITSLTNTLLPAMSRAYGKGGLKSVEEAFTKASRYVALICVPTGMGFAALSQPIVHLMAGTGYYETVLPLAVISISSIALGFAIPIIVGLQSLGETASIFRISIVALIVEILVGLVTIPILGIAGASLTRSVFFFSTLVYGVFTARRFLKIIFDQEAIWKSVVAGIVMAISVFALQVLYYSVILLPLYVAVGGFVYILALKSLRGLNDKDIIIIEGTLPKMLKWTVKPIQKMFK